MTPGDSFVWVGVGASDTEKQGAQQLSDILGASVSELSEGGETGEVHVLLKQNMKVVLQSYICGQAVNMYEVVFFLFLAAHVHPYSNKAVIVSPPLDFISDLVMLQSSKRNWKLIEPQAKTQQIELLINAVLLRAGFSS